MHLVRSLFFFLATYNMAVVGDHVENKAADALSHTPSFLSQIPSARRTPAEVPEELLQLLVNNQPDWTSHHWTSALTSFLQRV